MKRQLKNIIVGIAAFFAVALFVQCDSTTADEYKAQAIEYAESGEHEKAAEAYLKAAEKGDAEAQLVMGCLYMYGNELKDNPLSSDDKAALQWFEKSAKQNNDEALTCLGLAYLRGEYVDPDTVKAIRYFERAVELQNGLAAYFLGDTYEYGGDSWQDNPKAIKYYEIAYKRGLLLAGLCLSTFYLKEEPGEKYLYGLQFSYECWGKVKKVGLDPLDPDDVLAYDIVHNSTSIKI